MTVLAELTTEEISEKYEKATETQREQAFQQLFPNVKITIKQLEIVDGSIGRCWSYKVTISNGRKRTTKTFTDSVYNYNNGLEPTKADVLYCLTADANTYKRTGSLEDFCHEFGYDPYEGGAKIYNSCLKTYDDLCRVLGNEDELERATAIFETM